jgi:serine/threonine protein phosphatase PrpC
MTALSPQASLGESALELVKMVSKFAESCIEVSRMTGDLLKAGILAVKKERCEDAVARIIKDSDSAKVLRIQAQANRLYEMCQNNFPLPVSALEQKNKLKILYKDTCQKMKDYKTLEAFLETIENDKNQSIEIYEKIRLSGVRSKEETDEKLTRLKISSESHEEKVQGLQLSQKIWTPRKMEDGRAYLKMAKNSLKASQEARSRLYKAKDLPVYASPVEATALLLTPLPVDPLPPKSTIFSSEKQGKRGAMEDAHFCIEDEKKILAGVFDGHTSGDVSKYVNEVFFAKFEAALVLSSGNVHEAFENVFDQIQKELDEKQKKGECKGGSTAVVTYVDKITNLVYTATLGDSEANVYRMFNEKMKSIPLSCVRDWSSQKDAKRIALYYSDPQMAEIYPNQHPKSLRCGRVVSGLVDLHYGVNVSRAFGDSQYRGSEQTPLVISKPKITVNRLQEGDTIVLACDGLKDHVPEKDIAKTIQRSGGEDTAKKLVDSALYEFESTDNVTVVVIKIPKPTIDLSSSTHTSVV